LHPLNLLSCIRPKPTPPTPYIKTLLFNSGFALFIACIPVLMLHAIGAIVYKSVFLSSFMRSFSPAFKYSEKPLSFIKPYSLCGFMHRFSSPLMQKSHFPHPR